MYVTGLYSRGFKSSFIAVEEYYENLHCSFSENAYIFGAYVYKIVFHDLSLLRLNRKKER